MKNKEKTKPAWMSLRSKCHKAPIMWPEGGSEYCTECGNLCEIDHDKPKEA